MRRIVFFLFVCFGFLVASVLPMRASYAASPVPDLPVTQEDVAIFSLVPHQLTAKLNNPILSLDSEEVKAAPLLMRNSRCYFPLRWLEKAHVATIKWDAKTSSAWPVFNPEDFPISSPFRVKSDSSNLYSYSNGSLTAVDGTIPTTFTQGGQLYVPVMLLQGLGINYSWSGGELRMSWNDKDIKVLRPELTTQDNSITFSALEDKDYGHIYLMESIGIGGMTSVINGGAGNLQGTESVIGDPISLNGKEYQRVEYTVDLRPGENPLRIISNLEGYASILVHRQVQDPTTVPIGVVNSGEAWRISFTKPAQGYLRVHVGDPIDLAGQVTVIHNPVTQIPYQLSRFQNGDYEAVGDWKFTPLDENKKFSSSITIQKPGSYLINIGTPNMPNGWLSKWGEIAVEVLQGPNVSTTVSADATPAN